MSNISNLAGLPKFFLSDFSEKDHKWDKHRSDTQTVGEIYNTSQYSLFKEISYRFYRYAERIGKCSNILKFATTDDKLKLKHTFFCRVRYCPVCQWRRSMMWRAKFFQIMPTIQNQYPTHRWVFLTLTVKNCCIDDLRSTLTLMSKAWNKLIGYKELSAIDGFVRTTEVTRGEDGSAHPHYHCLLLVKPGFFGKFYIKQLRWRELWQKALMSDYLPMVNVKAVKGDTPTKAVLETLKYSTKPDDFMKDGDWFRKLTLQTHKMRFIATGGVLKGCLKNEDEITNEDLICADDSVDDTDTKRLAFFYNDDIRKYHRVPQFDED